MEIAQTADRAMLVLLSIADHGPATPSELAQRLDIGRTIAYRLLVTLQARGFVAVRTDGRYALGAELFRIAQPIRSALLDHARPLVEALAMELGETVVLSTAEGLDAVVRLVGTSTAQAVRVDYRVGFRHPLSLGASGRAILMALSEPARETALHKAADPGLARRRLADALALGYAQSHDELQGGVHGIAVPVGRGDDIGSISVLTPISRADLLPRVLPHLRKLAQTLKKALA